MTKSKTISTSDLQALVTSKTDFLLLDVLPKAQFDQDHIERAHNVPIDSADFLAVVGRTAVSKTKPIVVYCGGASSNKSTKAAATLVAAGHTDVRAYEGGLSAWRAEHKQEGATGAHGTHAEPHKATAHAAKPATVVNTGGSAGAHSTTAPGAKDRKSGGK